MITTALLIGFTIMSLASLALYATASKHLPLRHHTYFHSAVPFIAATSYLAMALGVGNLLKIDGTITFVARYMDWSFTTPLLLAGLVTTALHERKGVATGYMVAIIVLDVLMVVTGLVSSMSVVPGARLIWFIWSSVAFLGVLYILWVPLKADSREHGGPFDVAYSKNLAFLTVVWLLYPVVFAIGPEGLSVITTAATVWAILVLDVIAKVVFAFTSMANLDKAARSAGATV